MNKTILLVEDEIELQQNLKEILEFHGFSILTANNGYEATLKLGSSGVDLILCDVMMPIMDGYEFLKIVRSQLDYEQIPFMFLSAKARENDKEKAFAEGAVEYLVKPISARVLLNSVFEALNSKKKD